MPELTMDEKIASLKLMNAEEIATYLRDHPEVQGEIANRQTQARAQANGD